MSNCVDKESNVTYNKNVAAHWQCTYAVREGNLMAKRCQENDAEIRKMILDAAERIGEEQGINKITARRISNSCLLYTSPSPRDM